MPKPRKNNPEPQEEPRIDRVRKFGEAVLMIMEDHIDWSSDTMDDIHTEAVRFGLADQDDEGNFKAK